MATELRCPECGVVITQPDNVIVLWCPLCGTLVRGKLAEQWPLHLEEEP